MASSSVVSSRAESSRRSLVSSRPSSVDPMDIIGDNDVEYMVNGKPLPTLAGHIIVRWENYVYFAKQRPLAYHLAKDLPHSLEDRMNSMSDDFRNSDNARIIFEEAIQQNTDDEPDAPRIQIYNEVDEEATPPWEFHYTNRMWYGKGIPPPDVKNLASCNCRGKCNPKSRSCVCLKRQRQWLDKYVEGGSLDKKDAMGFLYDEKGRLRMQDFPIFECNKFCGCDDECTNRVVQNGRKCTVNIVKTENKGWGVFAWTKKIPKGSYIGIYAGELLTEQEGEIRGKVYNKIGRTYLFDVDFSHLKGLFGTSDEEPEWENRYVVDAFHAGNFTRFLNHSCNPNCTIVACYINEANIDKPLLTVFTSRDVEPYEELCFSYAGIDDEDPSKAEVKRDAVYGRCYCGAIGCRGQMFA
ncbi:hypothetical protein SERLADRAFT_391489 [Serpula lacrymans var. lacrymans S7.9]|nr:uncharacterized protein SERLADRAFT_391489 [Serpula lacrymans var. lacrymans S7.9]EGO23477.1 hypothetical protein SERLADRAFT_391489 [Serpula lacrymans var. lacrymans S7.9]